MNGSRGILIWVAGFAGVLLIYSAYKGKHPLEVVNGSIGATPTDGHASPVANGKAPGSDAINSASNTGVGYADSVYVYDAQGNITGTVPAAYERNPATYIPSRTA